MIKLKIEPLKDKETCLNCLNTPCRCGLNNSAFIKWNVTSAVEWLKEHGTYYDMLSHKKLSDKVAKDRMECGLPNTMYFMVENSILNKAFEDVIKK